MKRAARRSNQPSDNAAAAAAAAAAADNAESVAALRLLISAAEEAVAVHRAFAAVCVERDFLRSAMARADGQLRDAYAELRKHADNACCVNVHCLAESDPRKVTLMRFGACSHVVCTRDLETLQKHASGGSGADKSEAVCCPACRAPSSSFLFADRALQGATYAVSTMDRAEFERQAAHMRDATVVMPRAVTAMAALVTAFAGTEVLFGASNSGASATRTEPFHVKRRSARHLIKRYRVVREAADAGVDVPPVSAAELACLMCDVDRLYADAEAAAEVVRDLRLGNGGGVEPPAAADPAAVRDVAAEVTRHREFLR